MLKPAERLKNLYEIAENSSPQDFYLNIYKYIDFIEETSILSGIIDQEEHENSPKIGSLFTYRLSLLSSFTLLQAKIYKYIYWCERPDERGSDPIGVVLVFGASKERIGELSKRDREIIERDYTTEKQQLYRNALKQVHFKIMNRLSSINSVDKIIIVVDKMDGIYRVDNKLSYPIERGSKRIKLIDFLASKDNASLSELGIEVNQQKDVVMKSIAEINKLFREKLGVVNDLILSVPTGGYSLNKSDFEITLNS